MAGGPRRRRRLRIIAAGLVAFVAVVATDQRGMLAVGAAPVVAAGGATADLAAFGRTPITDFEVLRERLRAARPVLAPDESAPAAPEPVAEGDAPMATLPEDFQRTELADPAPPPPVVLRRSRYDRGTASGGTWALVIGINDYPGVRYDLRSAVNDANDVNDALAKLGVTADRRLVLRDRQAGADTIRAGVDWLASHAGADATMVLFYAGHVQRIEGGREALVGADGGVIPDAELAAMLDRSAAQRAWIMLASCYSGGFTEVVKPGRILTAAAPSNRVAYENEGFGRSYLVEYMVRRAMLSHGHTTVEGAFAWAVSELRRDYPERVPVQQDDLGGDLDLKVPPPPTPSGSAPAGSQPPPPPRETNPQQPPPPDPDDDCANLTVGVVRCQ